MGATDNVYPPPLEDPERLLDLFEEYDQSAAERLHTYNNDIAAEAEHPYSCHLMGQLVGPFFSLDGPGGMQNSDEHSGEVAEPCGFMQAESEQVIDIEIVSEPGGFMQAEPEEFIEIDSDCEEPAPRPKRRRVRGKQRPGGKRDPAVAADATEAFCCIKRLEAALLSAHAFSRTASCDPERALLHPAVPSSDRSATGHG